MGEMNEKSDVQLLRDYAEDGHEAAFRELVERYAGLVYAGALRQVASPDLARDLAQSVFTDLARKARLLVDQTAGDRPLAGWLHRSTRYAALNHGRDTRRRIANERQAMEQLINHFQFETASASSYGAWASMSEQTRRRQGPACLHFGR